MSTWVVGNDILLVGKVIPAPTPKRVLRCSQVMEGVSASHPTKYSGRTIGCRIPEQRRLSSLCSHTTVTQGCPHTPSQQSGLWPWTPTGGLRCSSVLTLSTWRQHQILRVQSHKLQVWPVSLTVVISRVSPPAPRVWLLCVSSSQTQEMLACVSWLVGEGITKVQMERYTGRPREGFDPLPCWGTPHPPRVQKPCDP